MERLLTKLRLGLGLGFKMLPVMTTPYTEQNASTPDLRKQVLTSHGLFQLAKQAPYRGLQQISQPFVKNCAMEQG